MASPRITVDPDGDLVLKFRGTEPPKGVTPATDGKENTAPEPVELLVSSKVMSLASPFFKVILQGRFKEGAEFVERKGSLDPYMLDLPEDDGEAGTILAKILHYDLNDIAARPSTSCLEKLAFMCDKYRCPGVLRFCGGIWLRDWVLVYENGSIFGGPSIDDLCRLLIFAYVADLASEFNDIAWKLFLSHKGPLTGNFTQAVVLVDHPLLGHDIAQHLDAERSKCCDMLHKGISAPLNRSWSTQNSGCFRAAKAIGAYLKSLRETNFLPYDLEFTQHKFSDLLAKSSSVPITNLSQFQCTLYNCTCQNELTYWLTTDFREQVRLISDKRKSFVCLDCIKTEGKSAEDGVCRAKHSKPAL